MKNKNLLLYVINIIFICSFSYQNIFGWGSNGHRITGSIANYYISEKTRNEIKKVIGEDSLDRISTIPDEMKSNTGNFQWRNCFIQYKKAYKKESSKENKENVEDAKGNEQNCKDVELKWKSASSWHFLNPDVVKTFEEVINQNGGNVYTAIRDSIIALQNEGSTIIERKNALLWIVHLIGDLHHPFHIGNASDLGGNKIIVVWLKKNKNLHRVWDTDLILSQRLSYKEFSSSIIKEYGKNQKVSEVNLDLIYDFVLETSKIASSIYKNGTDTSDTSSYISRYIPIVKEQLFKGGIRLAGVLDFIFKNK